jgi:2-keto-4-pentenoate hydratase
VDKADLDLAVALLADAARTGVAIGALPEKSRPASVAEALSIQDALVAGSGGKVAGWKVATSSAGEVMYGAIYADDCVPSPAIVESKRYPLLGLEAEVAYRFTKDLPARPVPYLREDVERILVPLAVFEIVDSRYTNYNDTPILDRLADRMSNGGMVLGPNLKASVVAGSIVLTVDGETVFDGLGEHARGDPLLPALDFVRAAQHRHTFQVGEFITTGTLTGLRFLRAGQSAIARYNDAVEIKLSCI